MADNVNNPRHYNFGSIEVIDAIEDWNLGFHAGNVVKYVARYRHKNGLEDLKKARWYLDRLIKNMEKSSVEVREYQAGKRMELPGWLMGRM